MPKRVTEITLVAMVMAVSCLGVFAKGKPGGTTTAVAKETYLDTQHGGSSITNITGDGLGSPPSTYEDGLQGVKCYIYPPDDSGGSGDAILDTRYGVHRVLNFRFVPAPVGGTSGGSDSAPVNSTNSTSEDVWVNIRGVNNLLDGNEQEGTASFGNSLGNFRFLGTRNGCNDCARSAGMIHSSLVRIKRIGDTWEVWTVPGEDIAVRLVYKGGAGGGGLVPVGYYHLPFRMTIQKLN